ncbi:type II secretion system protein GspF [Sesbania bispinosa]|nr:type II secretion system protein GspF [Sesbania bispinosa]
MTWQTKNTVGMMMWTLICLCRSGESTRRRGCCLDQGGSAGGGTAAVACKSVATEMKTGLPWDEEVAAVARRSGTTRSAGFTTTEMREGVRDSDFLQPKRGPHSAVAVMVVLISCSGRLVMGRKVISGGR